MLKHYFQLFRISNIFTVPPDILAGYFISVNNTRVVNYQDLLILVFSSVLLYVGGLATNDLFDLEIDKKERPNRPLPSGMIKKSTTIFLSFLFLGLGLLLASSLGIASTIGSVLLIVMILAYNYKLKNGFSRPFLMGSIRSLNVIYGSTSNYNLSSDSFQGNSAFNYAILMDLAIASFAVFVHIFTLTLISTRETAEEINKFKNIFDLKNIYSIYSFIFIVVLFIGVVFLSNKILYLSFFSVYLTSISFIFSKKIGKEKHEPADIQFIVKNMIVLLILLDASFVAESAGFYLGIVTSSLLIPCIAIGKKISMT